MTQQKSATSKHGNWYLIINLKVTALKIRLGGRCRRSFRHVSNEIHTWLIGFKPIGPVRLHTATFAEQTIDTYVCAHDKETRKPIDVFPSYCIIHRTLQTWHDTLSHIWKETRKLNTTYVISIIRVLPMIMQAVDRIGKASEITVTK